MKNKKQRKILLYLLVVLGLTIGFALLSTTLKINGTASIKSNNWDIHWDSSSISVNQDSVDTTLPTVSKGESDNDTVSFNVELNLPGDFYEFEIDAVNSGSIDGALDTITTKVYNSSDEELKTEDIPEYLKYSVTYDDGTPTTGDILKHGESKTYKVRVEFDRSWEQVPSTDEIYKIKVDIPYIQHKSTTTVDEGPVTITANKTTAAKNEEVKVTVTATDVAAWNLHLTGAIVSDEFVGANLEGDGENTTVSREFTLDTSTAGEKVINLTGDVTDENNHKTTINKSITITITE